MKRRKRKKITGERTGTQDKEREMDANEGEEQKKREFLIDIRQERERVKETCRK